MAITTYKNSFLSGGEKYICSIFMEFCFWSLFEISIHPSTLLSFNQTRQGKKKQETATFVLKAHLGKKIFKRRRREVFGRSK